MRFPSRWNGSTWRKRDAIAVKGGRIRPVPLTDLLRLELVRTPDILKGLGEAKGARLLVGFAAETEDVVANARRKLETKNLDLIVANDVTAPGAGFGGSTNAVVLLRRDGKRTDVPLASKREVAERILDEVIALRTGARVPTPA